jgi:hypothetical protein
MVPFAPRGMSADEVEQRCIEARRRFYRLSSILKRGMDLQVNGREWFMWAQFFPINLLFRAEVTQRVGFPLGDEAYTGPLCKARHTQPFDPTASIGSTDGATSGRKGRALQVQEAQAYWAR